MVDVVFLVLYAIAPFVIWWRSRSIAWTVIMLMTTLSVMGVVVNFVIDHVAPLTWLTLQILTLVALAIPVAASLRSAPAQLSPRRRQILAVIAPTALLGLFLLVVMTWWTEVPAFQTPVSFLMGHAVAEDNAKWLDFAAGLATGAPIEQPVPLGGPLQLFMTAIATLMAVVSRIFFGGVNEVMVAANTVIYAQFAFVALAPLALAPLAEATYRVRKNAGNWRHARIPAPLIWAGAVILVAAVLMATAYGHVTWQYTALAATLWVTAYLVEIPVPRARLLTSLVVVASMTVWLPMNVIALIVLIGWVVLLLARGVRSRQWDWIGLALTAVVAVSVAQPLVSSFSFISSGNWNASASLSGGGLGAGVPAAVFPLAGLSEVRTFVDGTLFAASGGTERTGPLLFVLAAIGAIGATIWAERQASQANRYVRFVPIGLLAGFALALQVLDQWVTGSAPNYGSDKFMFLATVVIAAGTIPVALLLVSFGESGMTAGRWVSVGGVLLMLAVDSLMIRSVAAARPEQWSPPIPFDNPRSYWWPADVNGTATQPISTNPIGCVYLPQGAKAPSAILESQLSDAQRVYSCTRLLAGLAGEDSGAQPMVDWLRREWLTNERAWEGVYGYLAEMPDDVLDRPVILLDDGSNVSGLESMRSLLARFPGDAWSN